MSMRGKLTSKSLRLTIYVEHAPRLLRGGWRIGADPIPCGPYVSIQRRSATRLQVADLLAANDRVGIDSGPKGSARSGLPTLHSEGIASIEHTTGSACGETFKNRFRLGFSRWVLPGTGASGSLLDYAQFGH